MLTATEIQLRLAEAEKRYSAIQLAVIEPWLRGVNRIMQRHWRRTYATYTDDMRQMLEDLDRAKETQ